MKYSFSKIMYSVCFFGALICGYGAWLRAHAHSQTPLDYIIHNGQPSESLQKLCDITGIGKQDSLQALVDATQKSWLRPAGKERWEIDHSEFLNSDEVWNIFDQMNLVQKVDATQKEYEYLLVLGATYSRVKTRLEHAVDCWNQGVRWKECVLLGGARPLVYDMEIEPVMNQYGLSQDQCPKTEAEMMKFVYENMQMPDEMRACKLTIIDVPMLDNGKGGMRRPTTQDTIEWWLKEQPKPGLCLAISSQPFVAYQYAVLISYIPKEFFIEVIGHQAPSRDVSGVGTYFDNLARILYQENIRMNIKQ